MYVATLLTNPETPVLEGSLLDALRNAWGGGDVRWLMPDVSAEFELEVLPDNVASVWDDLQAKNIDLCVQQSAGRKKRLLLADMDSTMIQQECIDELANVAGIGETVAAITARAMNGEIAFDGALRERVGLLKDLDHSVIETVFKERITYTPGGKALVSTMKPAPHKRRLISLLKPMPFRRACR